MFTFDHPGSNDETGLDFLRQRNIPDEIECGENNKYWIKAVRSKRMMILVSKEDGRTKKEVELGTEFERIAASYGLAPRQIGAVRDAMELK